MLLSVLLYGSYLLSHKIYCPVCGTLPVFVFSNFHVRSHLFLSNCVEGFLNFPSARLIIESNCVKKKTNENKCTAINWKNTVVQRKQQKL